MTAQTITADAITMNVDGNVITIPTDKATELIRLTLAARKQSYDLRRKAKAAERAQKTENRKAEQLIKLEARKRKLDAKIAKLSA